MAKNKQTNFIELRDQIGKQALKAIEKDKARRMIKGTFEVGILNRIDPRKIIAITVVAINTPLPTMSPITNPIIYKKIMKFDTGKFGRKLNSLKMRFM